MTMVLLPPSEGKTSAAGKSKFHLSQLSFPELLPLREKVLNGLISLSNGSPTRARTALGISVKQDWEIERNQILMTAATAPAWQVYTGVLYDAISFQSLSAPQLKKLTEMTFVQSALFGLISIADCIPAYRLSGDTTLPKVGTMSSTWAKPTANILAGRDDLIIDLRSGMYVKLGPIPAGVNAVFPKILQRMPSGPPKVISHHNKATKGRIVRAMVESRSAITTVDQLAAVISKLGADVVVKKASKSGGPVTMEVVVDVL